MVALLTICGVTGAHTHAHTPVQHVECIVDDGADLAADDDVAQRDAHGADRGASGRALGK